MSGTTTDQRLASEIEKKIHELVDQKVQEMIQQLAEKKAEEILKRTMDIVHQRLSSSSNRSPGDDDGGEDSDATVPPSPTLPPLPAAETDSLSSKSSRISTCLADECGHMCSLSNMYSHVLKRHNKSFHYLFDAKDELYCWMSERDAGQLGDGSTATISLQPTRVRRPSDRLITTLIQEQERSKKNKKTTTKKRGAAAPKSTPSTSTSRKKTKTSDVKEKKDSNQKVQCPHCGVWVLPGALDEHFKQHAPPPPSSTLH
jgi:hypothetical protein